MKIRIKNIFFDSYKHDHEQDTNRSKQTTKR